MLALQTILDGLVLGGLYALAAVGFSLIFGVLGVVNLSHGAIVLIGAYLTWFAWHTTGLDPLLCILPVMAVLFGLGYAYQRFLIQLAVDRSSLLASMLLFFLPTAVLGMIAPYSVRLLVADHQRSGHIAGLLYFISTLGSALGTLATSFYLVLWFEVNQILITMSLVLALAGLGAMLFERGRPEPVSGP